MTTLTTENRSAPDACGYPRGEARVIPLDAADHILRPAEWVLPGHPDRLADAVAERLVRAAAERDPMALCAIEVAVYRDRVYLTGRLACAGSHALDLSALAREAYLAAGYGERWRPAPADLRVEGNLCLDALADGEAEVRQQSDDQCIHTGYAIDLPGMDWLPPEQWLARELGSELYALVHGPLQLCPDGKLLVVLEEGPASASPSKRRWRWRKLSASLLAPDEIDGVTLHRVVRGCVQAVLQRARAALPGLEDGEPEILVNPGGGFHVGGPEGDNGLSGKKLLLDFYGPRVPIGGGALTGKDHHKPDRKGARIAREVALAVVRTGVADEATVTAITLPGDEAPRVLRIATPKGDLAGPGRWVEAFGGVGEAWRLRPIADMDRRSVAP